MPLVRRLGVLIVLLAAAAVWSGSALAAGQPAITLPPEVFGRPQPGQTLAATAGTWTNSPTSYAVQWQRCGGGCSDIPGATGWTYLLSAADAGYSFVAVVTATNASGSGVATSNASYVVTALSLGNTRFLVHYQSDPGTTSAITQTQAGDIAATAERAYDAELALGYPAPPSDGTEGGDSRIDIYVGTIDAAGVLATANGDLGTTHGYIVLNGATPLESFKQQTIAHELFHLIQFGIWYGDAWLLEGSAEWMGYKVDDFAGDFDLGNWDMALDCTDPDIVNTQCDLEDAYKDGGYSRWPFFEYVTERWGSDFVKNVFTQGAAGAGSATAALSSAIAAKGATLTDVFNDWTVANLTGGYSVEKLQTLLPPPYGPTLSTGTLATLNVKTKAGAPTVTSGPIPTRVVAVNHLSARFVAIRHGDPTLPDTPCYKATLTLKVALPAGSGAKPAFWWSGRNRDGTKQAAQVFSIAGDTASLTLPWDTCSWQTQSSETLGYLALPNPSTNLDGRNFTITGTLSVNTAEQATVTPPPDPVVMPGKVVDVSASDIVPRIEVFGPELIRIAAGSRAVRLIVSSSGPGQLRAALGSLGLGSRTVRAGGNDLRFTLPASAVNSLRRTSAASRLLTLTPVSTSGVTGKSIVRRVTVATPVKKASRARVAAGTRR